MLKMILALHIAGGSAALLSMFVPMVTKKGGRAHRRAGWVFVGGMTVVSATAFILAGWRALFDPNPGARSTGIFLFYIAILTAAGVSTGVRVLRVKHRAGAHRHPWDLGISSLLLATSVGMAGLGLAAGAPLLIAFSMIGFFSGGGQLAYWLRPPSHHMHWWLEHMSSMLGSCIAAATAFLVINAGNLGASQGSLLVWLAPTIIGTPTIVIWTAYYRRRFAASDRLRQGYGGPPKLHAKAEDAAYDRDAGATSSATARTSPPAPAAALYTPSRIS
jgi:hypothetical protein